MCGKLVRRDTTRGNGHHTCPKGTCTSDVLHRVANHGDRCRGKILSQKNGCTLHGNRAQLIAVMMVITIRPEVEMPADSIMVGLHCCPRRNISGQQPGKHPAIVIIAVFVLVFFVRKVALGEKVEHSSSTLVD